MKFASLLLFVGVFSAPALAAEPPKFDLKKGIPFAGRAEATVIQVRPRVTGLLTSIHVKDGEVVRKGDLLATLDDRVYKVKLTAAKAELTVAQVQAKVAAADFARIKEAVTKGIVNKSDFEKAEANLEEATARVEVAKAAVDLNQINLLYTKLTAPIDGRLTRFGATVGDLVTADKTFLVAVIADNPISAVFDVGENTALAINRAVKDGAKLNVEVGLSDEEGYPHKGVCEAKTLVVDPKTGTVQFRATLENPKGLILHGQYVRVKLSVQPK
jgi:multidrug efflux system membrane fusion protein